MVRDPGKTSPMSLMIMRSTLLVLLLAAGAGALELVVPCSWSMYATLPPPGPPAAPGLDP